MTARDVYILLAEWLVAPLLRPFKPLKLWYHRRRVRWGAREMNLRRLRKTINVLAAVPILVTLVPTPGTAQTPEREVRFTPPARAYLVAQWDTVHANQVERGYCLLVVPALDDPPSDTIDVVVGAFRAVARVANPVQTAFNCGPRMRYLHIHTPTTCDAITPHPFSSIPGHLLARDCRLGGLGSGLCFPSQGDIGMIHKYEQPWGMIQCAADAFVTFYPETAGHLYP